MTSFFPQKPSLAIFLRKLLLQTLLADSIAKKTVEDLLVASGENKHVSAKYNMPATMEEFVPLAAADGYNFSVEELGTVLKESGDVFEKNGNPAKRQIWWV